MLIINWKKENVRFLIISKGIIKKKKKNSKIHMEEVKCETIDCWASEQFSQEKCWYQNDLC